MGQRIVIDPLTRIEGHARVILGVDARGEVVSGHLEVLEIRGFEKLLERMELFKMPQITGRLCGVCPAAHHLAAVIAIENGLGVQIPKAAGLLRDLLYAGHILHSHALSTFVLLGPDVLQGIGAKPETRNIFSLLQTSPDVAGKALRLRTIGQRVVETVGGRGVHPVTAVPGGMSARPDAEKMSGMAQWGKEALEILEVLGGAIREKLDQMKDLREAMILPYHSVALSQGGTVSFLGGEVVVLDESGKKERSFTTDKYMDHHLEHVVPGSYMKSVRLRAPTEKSYFVGPLARLNVNERFTTPKADKALKEFRAAGHPRLSALDFIDARLIDMVHAAEQIAGIAGGGGTDGPLRTECAPREGRYIGLVEAPRGILIHDYTADADGRISAANLIVATQNNYDAIDSAITSMARLYMPKKDDALLMNGVEFAVRCFDPCLACATHAAGQMPLEIVIQRDGVVERTIARRAR